METEIPHMEEKDEEIKDIEQRIQNIEVRLQQNLRPESIWQKIKDLIAGYIVAVILFAIAWYFVGYWAILIAVVVFPVSYLYTKKIYKPKSTPILLVGHKDPENTNSMIIVDGYGIPDKIFNELDLTGVSTPITTPWGPGYLAEGIEYDENGDFSGIIFAWPHNNELNFLTKHGLFHYLREENYKLAKAYNIARLLLVSMAQRIGYEYAVYIIKMIGDEKIAKGLKGEEDEKQLISIFANTDKELRELRKKYGIEDVVDKDEAELVPEG